MLGFFRRLAKTWYFKILFVILIFTFGIYGVNSMLHGKINDDVISAGARSMNSQDFKTIIDDEKKRLEQDKNNGQPVSMEELKQAEILDQMAQELVSQQAFAAWMERIGMKPSEKVMADAMKNVPLFQNQVTGAFDKDAYLHFLNDRHMSEQTFQTQLQDDIAGADFMAAVRSGITLPRIYGAVEATTIYQTRDANWFVVGPANVTTPDKPTDIQLKQFIAENADRLRRPELRVMTAVMFVPEAVIKTVQVDEAELKKTYDFRKDSLSKPETRSFVLLPARTQQAAAALASSLKAGTDPAVAAKAAGVQPVAFQDRPKSAIPDAAVAAQAFSMQAGEVSQPVKGTLGWAVVKLISITPGHEVSFEEARATLEPQMRQKLAAEKIDDLVDKYQQLRDKGTSMADAAKALGLPMQKFPPFTKEGTSPNGQPYTGPNGQPFQPPKPLIDQLFSLPKGGESPEVEDAGGGTAYFALHVDDVLPSALPQVTDQTRAPLTQAWMQHETASRMKSTADALASRLRKGESLDAVAKSVNAPVQTGANLTRPQKQGEPDLQVRQAAFNSNPKDAFVVPTQTGYAVGQVSAVHLPATVLAAQMTEMIRPQMSSRVFEDLKTAAEAAARAKLKAKLNTDIMNSALSLQIPGAAGAAKKK